MSKPLSSVHARDQGKHEPSPQDLLRESPPPDPTDGLTSKEALATLEDVTRYERAANMPTGVMNGTRVPGNNKCGARMGRCFGQVVNGVCQSCGHRYPEANPIGGTNGRF
jgi:hypothetical protein